MAALSVTASWADALLSSLLLLLLERGGVIRPIGLLSGLVESFREALHGLKAWCLLNLGLLWV